MGLKKSLTKLLIIISFLLLFNSCQLEMTRSVFVSANKNNPLFFSGNEKGGYDTLSGPLQIAFASASVNFNNPISLTGFGAPLRRLIPPDMINIGNGATFCKPYQSIDHAPRVKVILIKGTSALSLQNEYYLIISIDVIAISRDLNLKVLNNLKVNFPLLNLDHKNVHFIATHTHSGPAGLSENPFWAAAICDRYNPSLYSSVNESIINTVSNAIANLQSIYAVDIASVDQFTGYNVSRFDNMDVDKSMFFINFKTSSQSLGCFDVFSAHPTWYGIADLVLSSDFAGYIESKFQEKVGAQTCVHFNGTVGNASIKSTTTLADTADRYTNDVFSRVVTTGTYPNPPDSFKFGTFFLNLPKFRVNFEGCGVNLNWIPRSFIDNLFSIKNSDVSNGITKIAWFSLKDTYFFLFPGEPLYDLKQDFISAIQEKFPNIQSYYFISTANDYVGYLMTPKNFYTKSIETCSTMHGEDASAILINAFMQSLKDAIQ